MTCYDLYRLQAENDRLRAELVALLAKVRSYSERVDWCPLCDRAPADDHTGHAAGCPLRVG